MGRAQTRAHFKFKFKRNQSHQNASDCSAVHVLSKMAPNCARKFKRNQKRSPWRDRWPHLQTNFNLSSLSRSFMAVLSQKQKKALHAFGEACASVGYVIPDAVCDVDDPLQESQASDDKKTRATDKAKRYGCYQQWARMLHVGSPACHYKVSCCCFLWSQSSSVTGSSCGSHEEEIPSKVQIS